MKKKDFPKILITGNPRSGTTTHQRVLKQCGLDIKHEEMGTQGTVSCYYFVDKRPYPHGHHVKDKKFNKRDFDAIYLLVRDPAQCIPSMRAIISPEHQIWLEELGFMRRFQPNGKRFPKSYTMANAWYNTNAYILEKLNPTVLLSESLESNIKRIVDKQTLDNLEQPLDFTWKNQSRGIFKAKPIQQDVIEQCEPGFTDAIKDQYADLRDFSENYERTRFKIGAIKC